MSDATLLNLIAAGHAMGHARNKEIWFCNCLACKFTKEYKISVQENDGSISETTMGDVLVETLRKEGHNTLIV